METKLQLDFSSPEFIQNPYPTYCHLREHEPVHLADSGVWYLTRYPDVYFMMTDPRFGRKAPKGASRFDLEATESTEVEAFLENWLLFKDPPEHTELRKVLAQVVNAKLIKAMEPFIARVADEVCQHVATLAEIDIVRDISIPMSMRVMCELLGVPDVDREEFQHYSDIITLSFEGSLPRDLARMEPMLPTIKYYIRDIIFDRQQHPKKDWISYLLEHHKQLHEPLNTEQLIDTIVFLLYSAHETTRLAISSSCHLLLSHPNKLRELIANPELLPDAIEELLRYESPLNKLSRWTHEDVRIGHQVIPAGVLVVGLINAAHRDPSAFENPYEIDFQRESNRHLTFGKGIHTCLGSVLARLELNILFERLLPLLSRWQLLTDKIQWRQNTTFRYLDSLPVRIKQ